MSIALQIDRAIHFSRVERLALEALALPVAEGRAAFDAWLECVEIDSLTPWMVRLVPPLYLRHAEGDPNVPHAARLRGITRFWYARNSLLISAAQSAVRALRDAGIDVAIFKGLSAAFLVHERTAARPMMDIDILVPRPDYARADEILRHAGWEYRHSPEQRMVADHSIDYVHPDGCSLDLHVRPLLEVRNGLLEPEVFARGRRIDWSGCSVIVPCIDDEVLIALVGAVRERARARLDWVSDMARMLERLPGPDWHAIWARARRYGVVQELLEAMLVLGDIRGFGRIHLALEELLSESPDVEQECVQVALGSCRTYGLPESLCSNPDREASRGVSAMRIVCDEWDAVVGIHLRRKHMHLVPSLLRVTDGARWAECVGSVPRQGEGLVELPTGLVEVADPCMPDAAHAARIDVRSEIPARLGASEQVAIDVAVTNSSPHPWPLPGSSQVPLGVSWHVEHVDGSIVTWDMPRRFLDTSAASALRMAYLEPGGIIECTIAFVAPSVPGRYVIRLDLVHERVCWFSQRGSRFPAWQLEVVA
jgi:hypothetical protein